MTCTTIKDILTQSEQRWGSMDAIRYKVSKNTIEAKTYTDLKKDSESFSLTIQALGEQGSHIALTGATSYGWIAAYFGIVDGGSVAVPLDASLPAEELCELIDRSDATVFVMDDTRKDVTELLKEHCPKVKYLILLGDGKDIVSVSSDTNRSHNGSSGNSSTVNSGASSSNSSAANSSASGDNNSAVNCSVSSDNNSAVNCSVSSDNSTAAGGQCRLTTLSFWELIREHAGSCTFEPEPDMLATIMFTSGTTGKSKGVMLTHRNLAENATCLDMKFPERTVLLSVLPIHHAYCLSMDILKGLSVGSIICINDSLMRVAKNIKLFEPNVILMVPLIIETMAKKLQDTVGVPPAVVKRMVFGKQLHTICSGGAYLAPDLLDLFQKYDITILQGYGMTECSPVISTTLSWNIRKGSVGQLLPNCEAKTVDEELWVRGSSVMQGYYKMPEETAETLTDGWLHTGDLGYADEEGFVYLTGRKKNLIITKNGENVSPEELENKLVEHRLVQEILVHESEGLIEAEIFPDLEYAKKKHVKDVPAALQELVDQYNQTAPLYKRIYKLTVRETEFEKTTSKKIKRYK
ncbi:MAG: AMP-binding protein [Lachnospiraceae bacterium]|nr:AMP-binding protein [Lachnospiraceae bacterium]